MIRFAIFQNGRIARQIKLNNPHLFAQDEIPVRGELEFVSGELIARRPGDTAVGLLTLWDAAQSGKLLLQTTRLPIRDKPYNLNVELARGRLLRISQKREEWGMNDLTLDEQNHQLIDNALDAFVAALCQLDQPGKAALAADQSLAFALQAGEAMDLPAMSLVVVSTEPASGTKNISST